MTMATKIPCAACQGTGMADLSPVYRDTLAALSRGWTGTTEIRRKLGERTVQASALCNRLGYLAQVGLVEKRPSERLPHAFEWRRAA